jgi:hypothetical protein
MMLEGLRETSHRLKADAPGSNLSKPFQALFDAVDWIN